jgi:hypothetical protein
LRFSPAIVNKRSFNATDASAAKQMSNTTADAFDAEAAGLFARLPAASGMVFQAAQPRK